MLNILGGQIRGGRAEKNARREIGGGANPPPPPLKPPLSVDFLKVLIPGAWADSSQWETQVL